MFIVYISRNPWVITNLQQISFHSFGWCFHIFWTSREVTSKRMAYIAGIYSLVKLLSFSKSTQRCKVFIMMWFKEMEWIMEQCSAFQYWISNLQWCDVMCISWLLDQNMFDMTMGLPQKRSSIKTFKRLCVDVFQECQVILLQYAHYVARIYINSIVVSVVFQISSFSRFP